MASESQSDATVFLDGNAESSTYQAGTKVIKHADLFIRIVDFHLFTPLWQSHWGTSEES